MALPKEIAGLVTAWQQPPFDTATREEIAAISDEKELINRFFKPLEFGTGGMRGIMAAGTNRMNVYTIAAASQGLANYVLAQEPEAKQRGIAISYDSRLNSRAYAEISAAVFASAGIVCHIFPELHPVPLLSYAVRRLGCIAGVMITASHNPTRYNGYKVFWEDGCQVTAPADQGIIEQVRSVTIGSVTYRDYDALAAEGMIRNIGADLDEAFYDEALQQINAQDVVQAERDLPIVFTPIHGTGNIPVRRILEKMGFSRVMVVPEQREPDGNFPTVEKPNPEEREAMALAVNLAEQENAELVLATDPDADRVGIGVRDLNGNFILLNGNQTGAVLIDYILARLQEKNKLPENGAVITTIVTSDLLQKIGESYGVACFETLTGFKYIGSRIREFELQGSPAAPGHRFIVGGEESYGYLIGDFVRDKDAVTACAVLAEIAAFCRHQGSSIYRYLLDIYRRFGCYKESLVSRKMEGKEGMERIATLMSHFRSPAAEPFFDSLDVERVLDYQQQSIFTRSKGERTPLQGFPVSNVIQLLLRDGSKISLRPSGTEPKIKYYFSAFTAISEDSDAAIEKTLAQLDQKLAGFEQKLDQETVKV